MPKPSIDHNLDFALAPRFDLESPHLADYFGVWSIHGPTLQGLVDRLNGTNLHLHLQSNEVKQEVAERVNRRYLLTTDGIALVPINGPTMKSVPSMAAGTSTVLVRKQLRQARRDNEVLGAMLLMDTPGGTAKGVHDLAAEIAAFAEAKPIFAFIEDTTASAGVAFASQATERWANTSVATYGAMGTYSVIEDSSGEAAMLGVKVHVIKAGDYKGLGEPGSAITHEQLLELQRIVDSLNESYLKSIAKGTSLPLSTVRELADGRVIFAGDAAKAGLIHGVQSLDAVYARLVARVRGKKASSSRPTSAGGTSPTPRSAAMPPENDGTNAATLAELKSTFPNSTAEWREQQIEAGATLVQASVAYAKFVEQRAADEKSALQKQLDEAKAAGAANAPKLGNQPLRQAEGTEEYSSESGDPIEDFGMAVAKLAGPTPNRSKRQAAIRYIAARQPELHKAYLLATNKGARQQRQIKEKLEGATA